VDVLGILPSGHKGKKHGECQKGMGGENVKKKRQFG